MEKPQLAGKALYNTTTEFSFTHSAVSHAVQEAVEKVANSSTGENVVLSTVDAAISVTEKVDSLAVDSAETSSVDSGLQFLADIPSIPDSPEELFSTPIEEIETTASRLERLRGRLGKSQSAMSKSMLGLLGGTDLDEESWEEIEDSLISADIGARNALEIVSDLRQRITARGVQTSDEAKKIITEVLVEHLHPEWDRSIHAIPEAGKPAVILIIGVNGTGKTSTTGKLARVLMANNITVHLAAADTFRAAAADQLELWAKRSGTTITRADQGTDPSSVAFDGVARAIADQRDAVIVDTAGRLHNKIGLMDELAKIKRVVEKQAIVSETLLVLDATIGQNGLIQAKTFAQSVEITGVVLTKLDGTAKGGIVFQVQDELHVPLKLVGLGEGADDLAPFDPHAFVQTLLG